MADHQASKIDKANHLLLDQPLLRLPYELLRNNFRSAHFTVEKESVAVKNGLKESATAGLNGRATPDDVLHSLDAMLARMRGVKRKLETCAGEEARLYGQVDARTAHLAELADMHMLDDVAYEAWSRKRLDRLLVDYLLRHGYGASADALVADDASGTLRDLVDIDTFAHMSRIRTRLLRDRSVTEALAWCADNKKELRKMESRLEFMLRYQQYIELVRTQASARMVDAIAHARRYLFPLHHTYPDECNQAAVLLCYPPLEAPAEYAELWSPDRWTMLADLFTQTHNQLLALPSVPLLHLALSSGLSALKTPACHSSAAPAGTTTVSAAVAPAASSASAATSAAGTVGTVGSINGHRENGLLSGLANGGAAPGAPLAAPNSSNSSSAVAAVMSAYSSSLQPPPPQPSLLPVLSSAAVAAAAASSQVGASVCPICSPELNELARYVPYAHHSKSHAEQDTMMLPNGRVYSRARLEEHARKSGLAEGMIKDLRTGDIYSMDRLKKVYIF